MKVVDFYKLPRSIQDRFVGSLVSGFPPAPMLVAKGGTPIKLFWLAVSFAGFVLLLFATRLGYGNLESALSLHSAKALPIYLGLVFAIGFGLVQAYARLAREKALPYTAGIYLFPACVIDARSDQFRIYDTKDVTGVALQGTKVRVTFGVGVEFVFPVADAAAASTIVAEVNAARDRAMHAHATEDQSELVAVDPLHNPRFSSPVGPRDPYALAFPPWGKFGYAVAGALAILIGPSLWLLRNAGSDKRMFARATTANDTPSYRQYLAHGEARRAEVEGILLPRAELRDAVAIGTVDALLKYKSTHPSSKIGPEVAVAVRSAMLQELEKAKAKGSLAALQEFSKSFPEHGVDKELREAIHAVYARELEAYKKRAPAKHEVAMAFVDRLFAWAERRGPKVEIRFRRKTGGSLERADQSVLKTPNFMGVVTYPSRFFDEKHAQKREDRMAKAFTSGFAGFSAELFDISTGALVTDQENLPDPQVPTLFLTHLPEWSGHNYTTNRPRGSFVGMNFTFDATFVIPGDPKPWKYKDLIFKHAAIHVLKEEDPPLPPGQAEDKVYETMAEDAFEQFTKRVLSHFFVPTKEAK